MDTGKKGFPDKVLHAFLKIPGICSIQKRSSAVRHKPDDELGLVFDDTPVPGFTHLQPFPIGNLIGDILDDQRDAPASVFKYRRYPFHAEVTLFSLQGATHPNDLVRCAARLRRRQMSPQGDEKGIL